MPINIPSGLYTGGRSTFDTSPMTTAILKDLASQKAAKEAIVKNANNLYKQLNSAGVRQIDQPQLNSRMTEWYNNAKAGNVDYGRYQEILNEISQSKKRAETIAEIGKLSQKGNVENDENDVAVVDNLNKSIYEPKSYKQDGNDYGIGDLSQFVPQFDPTKQSQAFTVASSKAKPTYNEGKARVDNVTGKVYLPKEYTEEDVKNIAEGYGNLALGSREMQKHYNNLRKSPEFMTEADAAYKSVYGQNANITTAAEAAKADAIMKARLSGEEVQVTDPNYANKLKKDLENLRFANRKKFEAIRQANRAALKESNLSGVTNILDAYSQSYGVGDINGKPLLAQSDIPSANIKKGDPVKVVYVDQIDTGDLPIIQGTDLNKGIAGNKPISIGKGGRFGYIVTDAGWVGQGGLIDKQSTLDRQIKAAGTQATKIGSQGARGGQLPQTSPPAAPKQKKISDYPSDIQNAIKAYMGSSKLNEIDAINKLIKAGKLK
jgi:hypothetical protein